MNIFYYLIRSFCCVNATICCINAKPRNFFPYFNHLFALIYFPHELTINYNIVRHRSRHCKINRTKITYEENEIARRIFGRSFIENCWRAFRGIAKRCKWPGRKGVKSRRVNRAHAHTGTRSCTGSYRN